MKDQKRGHCFTRFSLRPSFLHFVLSFTIFISFSLPLFFSICRRSLFSKVIHLLPPYFARPLQCCSFFSNLLPFSSLFTISKNGKKKNTKDQCYPLKLKKKIKNSTQCLSSRKFNCLTNINPLSHMNLLLYIVI